MEDIYSHTLRENSTEGPATCAVEVTITGHVCQETSGFELS